ncbi:type 1 glutamine amidotransferase domain-containing protein [Lysobacter sp. CA196]|uniref:type 1 glutamine amidotransferase domain-containing protein n=1 Tax=Lysobacter sp. CA196 TaxID=3455606 RepID=UPI003F8D6EFC
MRTGYWKKRKTALLAALCTLSLLAVAGYGYVAGFRLDEQRLADSASRASDLSFVRVGVSESRGRVLAVLTSTAMIGASGKKAGFELTELSRAYYVFVANGFEVDIASPLGGKPPMRLDDELVAADYAFLNDAQAIAKLDRSLTLAQVDASRYAAVYFVGGKGAMFDFPGNREIQRIVAAVHANGGVVGAVCHGPAALLEVRLGNGRRLIDGRRMTGFSNDEELFLLKDARRLFPFLLQDRIADRGARYVEGPIYLDNTVVDGRLVTGQNPWSTWSVAEAMVAALGHVPVSRERTSEEVGVRLLNVYYREGRAAADRAKAQAAQADRRILLMHALVAAMQYRWRDAFHIQRLARP